MLRCLSGDEAMEVMHQSHAGILAEHQGGRKLFPYLLQSSHLMYNELKNFFISSLFYSQELLLLHSAFTDHDLSLSFFDACLVF